MFFTSSIRVSILTLALIVAGSQWSFGAPQKKEITNPKFVSSYEKLTPGKRGGVIYLSMSNNPKVINPILSADNNSSALDGFLWATLFTEDPETLEPLPYLAESYSITPDRKRYTFTLDKEAKWQDGTPVTTEDIKFSFDTLMDPKTAAASLRSYWEGVKLEILDAQRFVFSVDKPRFDTLRSLYAFQTIQKKQFAGEQDFNKARGILNPVGNGPYIFKTFSRDQKIELERNKNWWATRLSHFKNRYNFDKVVFRIIPDPNLEYEKLIRGDIDVIEFLGSSIDVYAEKVKKSDKEKFGASPKDGKPIWASEVVNSAPRGFSYVGWNLRNPLFASKKTRQAMAHLADVKQISDKIFYGYYYQCTSPFGSKTMNSAPELQQPGKRFDYNLKKALELLREDGWADTNKDNILDKVINGKRVDFKFELKYNSNNPTRGKIAQILKESFKAAGIGIEIRSMEWNAFLTDVDNRNFEAVILGWTATPFPNPYQTWHTDSEKNGGSNFVAYSNKKVDELILKANAEFDIKKRAQVLQEINRIIYDDQPYLFLVEPRSMLMGINSRMKSPVWAMKYDVSPAVDLFYTE